ERETRDRERVRQLREHGKRCGSDRHRHPRIVPSWPLPTNASRRFPASSTRTRTRSSGGLWGAAQGGGSWPGGAGCAARARAARQTPETVRAEYAETYRELRAAGYTAVGEFHYLGFGEALAAADAAREAQIELTLLLSAYARGGLPRFRQDSPRAYLDQV